MSEKDAVHGIACPRCGGMVPIPEGAAIVICPFCDLRSVVRGDNGVRRYQVPLQVDRAAAEKAMRSFLGGNMAIGRDVPRKAELTEALVVHLPFWAAWGRAVGWVFGKKRQSSGKHTHYVPREVKVTAEMNWNEAACEVGEFGVTEVSLQNRNLQPFDPVGLHRSGMVFEPVGSADESLVRARQSFEQRVQNKAGLDRVSQVFVRILRQRAGLVYYPLWVLRYTYRNRAFQVVVDGFNGEVLYGKAPGSVTYRAGALVGGMALGAFVGIDIAFAVGTSDDDGLGGGLALFAAGMGMMYWGFRTFRYGEHYEYRRRVNPEEGGFFNLNQNEVMKKLGNMMNTLEDLK